MSAVWEKNSAILGGEGGKRITHNKLRLMKQLLQSIKEAILMPGALCNLLKGFLQISWHTCSLLSLPLAVASWYYASWIAFVLFCCSMIGYLYMLQDNLVYQPETPATARCLVESPHSFGIPYEQVILKTPDGCTLYCYFLVQPKERRAQAFTFLYCHGNAGNIGNRLVPAAQLQSALGVNVLLLEYRGYGFSTGSASEQGLYTDAETALEYLLKRPDINPSKLVLFGRSLGGAVCTYMATESGLNKNFCCCILENTFTSLQSMGAFLFRVPVLNHLPEFVVKNLFPSLRRVEQMSLPTLFISGASDRLVPPGMMQLLHSRCSSSVKRLAVFPLGAHDDTWTNEGYLNAVGNFLSQLATGTHVPTH